jgi:hypothetical protein
MKTPINCNKRMRCSESEEMTLPKTPMAPLPAKRLPCRSSSSFFKPLSANVLMPSSLDLDLHLELEQQTGEETSRQSTTRVPAAAARLRPRPRSFSRQQQKNKKALAMGNNHGWEELLRLSHTKTSSTDDNNDQNETNKSSLSLDALLSLPTTTTNTTTTSRSSIEKNTTAATNQTLKPSRSWHALCA